VTNQGEVEGGDQPAAFGISISRDQRSFSVNRWTPPTTTPVFKDYTGHHVECGGYEEDIANSIYVVEDWNYWPFIGTGQGIPLDRQDPTIPWTTSGEHIDQQHSHGYGGDGDPIVVTRTWHWQLTLEPDPGQ